MLPTDRRRAVPLIGALVALAAGGLVAVGLGVGHRGEKPAPPPASKGGLVIDPNAQPDDRVDPQRTLRCFVAGQFVGEMTLGACAQRNGVATDALDVGMDPSGQLAAAQQAGTVLTPLPPPNAAPAPVQAPPVAAAPQAASAPAGACWRYEGGQWRKLPQDLTLSACVQTLFAGRCEKPGQALYGRWMSQTLRLVPGKVEVSGDNRSFRSLVEQGADCSVPTVG